MKSILKWSDESNPNSEVCYNHVTAETPFGRFLITWKGWKVHDSPTIDETPWGEFGGVGCDLEDAKKIAEEAYRGRLDKALNSYKDSTEVEDQEPHNISENFTEIKEVSVVEEPCSHKTHHLSYGHSRTWTHCSECGQTLDRYL